MQNKRYFLAQLPPIEASWSKGKTIDETTVYDIRKAVFDYKKEPYFAMISAAYVASFLCGLGKEHAMYDGLAGTVARYHFYYQVRKFMIKPSLLTQFDLNVVRKNIPVRRIDVVSKGRDANGNKFVFDGYIEHSSVDYRSFIASHTNGLTKLGLRLLQESIESFVYCVLGAQAKTRWSILDGVLNKLNKFFVNW